MVTTPPRSGALTTDAVREVMSALAARRKVFHSEADFQHAFGQQLGTFWPQLKIRLEMPYRVIGPVVDESRTMVDLFCEEPASGAVTAIEFKYRTRKWCGSVGKERFLLRDQSAVDLGRRYFVDDIWRLEQWTAAAGGTAFAILLTNEPAYWEPPTNPRPTNDADYRLHEGRTLFGGLRWWQDPQAKPSLTLNGRYSLNWKGYEGSSELVPSTPEPVQGKALELRYLLAEV